MPTADSSSMNIIKRPGISFGGQVAALLFTLKRAKETFIILSCIFGFDITKKEFDFEDSGKIVKKPMNFILASVF